MIYMDTYVINVIYKCVLKKVDRTDRTDKKVL